MKIFKTPKGTELQVMDIHGKDYLQVNQRIIWFREEKPSWGIETKSIFSDKQFSVFEASIKDETGRVIAMAHKSESSSNFGDFMEKAETGAIGRALALIGYGTQFCGDELNEGKRIVDAPLVQNTAKPQSIVSLYTVLDEYIVPFGKKHKGKRFRDMAKDEIEGYAKWIVSDSVKTGKPVSKDGSEFCELAKKYIDINYPPLAQEDDVPSWVSDPQ